MQEDDAHVEPALAGERVADAVEHLGEAVGGRDDEQRRNLAGIDVGEKRLRQRMGRGLGDVRLERLAGELAVVLVDRMARIGVGHPERRRVLLEGLGEGLACDVMPAGDVGDQRAMIALIELRPIGVAQAVERREGVVGLAGGLLHPGAGERRGQIGDRTLAGGGEMLVGFLVVAALEGIAAKQELGDAMRRLDLDEVLGERDGAVPVRGGSLEQEGLLENDLVAGILGQGLGIEVGGGNGVVVAAGHPARQIVAEQGAGLGRRSASDGATSE